MDIQRIAWQCFSKKNGYALRPDVILYLSERILLSNVPVDKVPKLVEYIADNFAAIVGKTVDIVDRKTLDEVVERLFKTKVNVTASASNDPREFCEVVTSGLLGKWKYNEQSNSYEQSETVDMFRQHYILLRKKFGTEHPTIALHNINSLKGKDTGSLVACFGMLQEFKEGEYHLEDLDDAVKLEVPSSCLIDYTVCKNFFVLVLGTIDDHGWILAQKIESISSVDPKEHNGLLPSIDYSSVLKRLEKRIEIESVEIQSQDFCICFINDPWLDLDGSKAKLTRLLESFNEEKQIAFIICGHLFSPHFADEPSSLLKEFAALVVRVCPRSLFIFSNNSDIPLFPQAPLPSSVFKTMIDHNLKVLTAQNPAKIVYCTQEIVVFDDSLCRQLYRNSLSRLGNTEPLTYEKCKREVRNYVC